MMPGLNFACDLRGHSPDKTSCYRKSLDALLHTDDYRKKVLLDGKFYFLGCTFYPEYPYLMFEDDDFHYYLEGQIYAVDSTLKVELNRLAQSIFHNCADRTHITEWLLNTDGDFIIFILHKKSNRLAILNDALGRLPLYYFATEDELLVSRELRFIVNTAN